MNTLMQPRKKKYENYVTSALKMSQDHLRRLWYNRKSLNFLDSLVHVFVRIVTETCIQRSKTTIFATLLEIPQVVLQHSQYHSNVHFMFLFVIRSGYRHLDFSKKYILSAQSIWNCTQFLIRFTFPSVIPRRSVL